MLSLLFRLLVPFLLLLFLLLLLLLLQFSLLLQPLLLLHLLLLLLLVLLPVFPWLRLRCICSSLLLNLCCRRRARVWL